MTAETSPHFRPTRARETFMLLIWPENQPQQEPLWRGMLETSSGLRRYFCTLAQLNQLLIELGHWVELAASTAGEPPDEDES